MEMFQIIAKWHFKNGTLWYGKYCYFPPPVIDVTGQLGPNRGGGQLQGGQGGTNSPRGVIFPILAHMLDEFPRCPNNIGHVFSTFPNHFRQRRYFCWVQEKTPGRLGKVLMSGEGEVKIDGSGGGNIFTASIGDAPFRPRRKVLFHFSIFWNFL